MDPDVTHYQYQTGHGARDGDRPLLTCTRRPRRAQTGLRRSDEAESVRGGWVNLRVVRPGPCSTRAREPGRALYPSMVLLVYLALVYYPHPS